MAEDYRLPVLSATDALRAHPPLLIDVRKRLALLESGRLLRDARWIDPFALDFAHPVLARGPLLFYCRHGHEVSRFATALALVAGIPAAYVAGGYAALADAGAETRPLEEEDLR